MAPEDPNDRGGRRARVSRLIDVLGSDGRAVGQTLGALGLNSFTSFIAGIMLVALVPAFRRIPGLLVLTTPAIGLSGNVFTTLGNRLSTSIHLGTFRPGLRVHGVMGGNLLASATLIVSMSVVLAAGARVLAIATDVRTVSFPSLVAIAVVGGLLGALPNAVLTVAMAVGATRWGWDLDNLVAPIVSTFCDVLTIPALWIAAVVLRDLGISNAIGVVTIVVAAVLVLVALRHAGPDTRRIVSESVPILAVALLFDTSGGLVLQGRLDALAALPAVFVLVPAFVSSAGALGGIFCGRSASALHLGSLRASVWPNRAAHRDIRFLVLLSLPVFLVNGLGAVAFSHIGDGSTAPGWGWTVGVSITAGALTMFAVVMLSWWATVGAWRIGVDPDSAGVPIMSAAIDVIGAITIVTVVAAFGLH